MISLSSESHHSRWGIHRITAGEQVELEPQSDELYVCSELEVSVMEIGVRVAVRESWPTQYQQLY